jgi:hypothetical protein
MSEKNQYTGKAKSHEEEIPAALKRIAFYHLRRKCSEVRSMAIDPPADDWRQVALMAVTRAQKTYDEKKGASLETWVSHKAKSALKSAKKTFLKEVASPDTILWWRVNDFKALFRLEAYRIPSEAQLEKAGLKKSQAHFFYALSEKLKTRNKKIRDRKGIPDAMETGFGIAPAFEALGVKISSVSLQSIRARDCYKILKEVLLQSREYRTLNEEYVVRNAPPLDEGELPDVMTFYRTLEENMVHLGVVPTILDLVESEVFDSREDADQFHRARKKIATMPHAEFLSESENIDVKVAEDFLKRWVPHRIQHCGFLPG